MKKMIITLVFSLFALPRIFGQQNVKLAVGMKAPDWMFTDADKKEFTMNSWAGKVIQINYVDPDESELNESYSEAVNKVVDVDKRISRDFFKGFGIVDCKSTWKPEPQKADNRRLLRVDPSAGTVEDIFVASPAFEVPAMYAVATQDPKTAYELILAGAGATLPKRDAIDARIVQDVKNRTGKIINSQNDVGGYPTYNSAKAPADTDNDGMPDEWEKQHGLNPTDPADGVRIASTGYSHLEEYLNSLDGKTL